MNKNEILALTLSQFAQFQNPIISNSILRGIACFSISLVPPIENEDPKVFAERICSIPLEQLQQLEFEYSKKVKECSLDRVTVGDVIAGWYKNVEFYKRYGLSVPRFVKVWTAEVLLKSLEHLEFPAMDIYELEISLDELRRINELEVARRITEP